MTGHDAPLVIVLAAGLGSRLGEATAAKPKCLVDVAGRPILGHILDGCRAAGTSDLFVAVGYCRDQVREFVATQGQPFDRATFVENEEYAATGTARSLLLALDAARASDGPLVVIEGDTAFAPAALQALMRSPHEIAFAASPYDLEIHSGTRLFVDPAGQVRDVIHASDTDGDGARGRAYKTANLHLFRTPASRKLLRKHLVRCIAEAGPTAPSEFALRSLVADGPTPCFVVELGDTPWFEVDTAQDRERADELFKNAPR